MGDDQTPKAFDALDARLKKAREDHASSSQPGGGPQKVSMPGFGMAMRVGVEMVAALIVGVGIGLVLDNWLETKPIFLVLFFFLGAAAGVLNVYRAASGEQFGGPKVEKLVGRRQNGDEDSQG